MAATGKETLRSALSRLTRQERLAVIISGVLALLSLGALCVGVYDGASMVGKNFPGFLVNQRLVVLNWGQNDWSGAEAGLGWPDKIIAVDGIALQSTQHLYQTINNIKIGARANYTIEREKTKTEKQILVMEFSWRDFFGVHGMHSLIGLLYIAIGVLVFAMKLNRPVSWAFFMACGSLGLYYAANNGLPSPNFSEFTYLFLFANALFPGAAIHMAMHFPQTSKMVRRYPLVQVLPYLISMLLAVPILYLYPEKQFVLFWNLNVVYMAVAGITVLLPIAWAVIRPIDVLARQRAKVVLFGAVLAFPLPAVAFTSQVMFGSFFGFKVNTNITSTFLIIFPIAIAYAIIRHNLFDVDTFIRRTIGYGIMTGVVAISYIGLQTGITKLVLIPTVTGFAHQLFPVVFALLVVLFFHPIQAGVQGVVDKMFYRKKYDYKDTVREIEQTLTSMLDVKEIMGRIINTVRGRLFIDTAGLILIQKEKNMCLPFFVGDDDDGGTKNISQNVCILPQDCLLTVVSQEKKLLTRYDIEEDQHYHKIRDECIKRFDELRSSLAVPLLHRDELIGVLFLGQKKSGQFYDRGDIDVIHTLATRGAVAIDNAMLAERMTQEEVVRTNLARYLSPQIVERVVNQDVELKLGGERKRVTVLFADIRNFTTITESQPADKLVKILNEYFGIMAGTIFKHDGSLDKYIGDAMVAVFGSLIEVDNAPANAVWAAIDMMERMPALNAEWQEKFGFSIQIGIGIATGEVILGNVGSAERMEFTVIGDTVNVASRLSGIARGGQILAVKPTIDVLEKSIRWRELSAVKVKGKMEEIDVFEIDYRVKGARDTVGSSEIVS
jgi:adenylate cyclase